MAPTTNWRDCRRFADAVAAAGGELPDALGYLLSAYEVLSSPVATAAPENAIVDAILAGAFDEKAFAKLLPAAATAAIVSDYAKGLAPRIEHILLGAFHRQIKGGCADQVLDSMRPAWDRHAAEIEKARGLFNAQSSAEQIIESGKPELVGAWQTLNSHIAAIGRMALAARQFGPRLGDFPMITEYALGENMRLVDSAIMCTDGPLEADSAVFNRPDQGHRSSPWFRCALRLHSIESARARYNDWAAREFDRVHSGPRGRFIDPATGQMVEDPLPVNLYRAKVSP